MQRFLKFLLPAFNWLTNYMASTGLLLQATDTLLTISMITNEALMVLENELTFAGQVMRTYDDSFGIDGAKIGDTLNVRRPPRFVGTSGPALNVEDYNQTSIPVVVGSTASYGDQFHVDVAFTTKDMRLSLGSFSENVIVPAVAAVANRVDFIGLQMAKNSTANIVGTPGTPPTSLLTYLNAGAYLTAEATPKGKGRSVCIEQFTGAAIVDSLKGLFNPAADVGRQYKSGRMGTDSAGMDWYVDQNINNQTFGNWVTATGTLQTDTTSIGIATGWASTTDIVLTNASSGITFNKGDVVSIANVFPVNPQNRQIYGTKARYFVVQKTVTAASGAGLTITVAPAVITAGQFQNVSITTTSSTATVTPYNISATAATAVTTPQNILFHKNAYTLVMPDLPMVGGVDMSARASSKESGMSIRVVRQYTINNDQLPTRFDVLFGWAPLYQELACRVAA